MTVVMNTATKMASLNDAKENQISELEKAFNSKLTENGDLAYCSTGNKLSDILFMSEYFSKHLGQVSIGCTPYEQLFSMFIRDPRFGIGRRDLGRELMKQSKCLPGAVISAGRWDDIFHVLDFDTAAAMLKAAIDEGDELAKKWAPRYSSKNLMLARQLAHAWGMNKQQYGKFVKANTVERALSEKDTDRINFEHVPSLALLKYWKRFLNGSDTGARFNKYIESVKKGDAKMNVSTTTVYDIYRNRQNIDPDVVYKQMEKISGSWLPIVDVSGSMWDSNDSLGKAISIGMYLADTSTYCPNTFITFSSRPQLIKLDPNQHYNTRIDTIRRADWGGNTDLRAVMEKLTALDRDLPEFLVIMSDMEFDWGSSMKKDALMILWKQRGWNTKIIWWNFNSRATTCPETDSYGNIFMSGYNPMLLKYLEAGFDNNAFVGKLLAEYVKNIKRNLESK